MSFRNINMMAPDFGRENLLHLSWYDSAWIPILNQQNVMDYFSERSNPFYDRTCNNEVIKMQRLSPEHLSNMTGVEFVLLHVQEPILYVIRKQQRHSPTQVTPMADFYILSGVIYQAPDLCSVINSRLLNAVHSLKSVFDESLSYARYHQSKGYWWEFKNPKLNEPKKVKEEPKKKEEPSSHFQRQRVDILLGELAKNFPLKVNQPPPQQPQVSTEKASVKDVNVSVKDALDASKELVAKALAEKRPVDAEKRPLKSAGASDVSSLSSGDNRPPPDKKPKLIR